MHNKCSNLSDASVADTRSTRCDAMRCYYPRPLAVSIAHFVRLSFALALRYPFGCVIAWRLLHRIEPARASANVRAYTRPPVLHSTLDTRSSSSSSGPAPEREFGYGRNGICARVPLPLRMPLSFSHCYIRVFTTYTIECHANAYDSDDVRRCDGATATGRQRTLPIRY